MSIVQLPFDGINERFTTSLEGRDFVISVRWNEWIPAWEMSIGTAADGVLATPIPIVGGADLIDQYRDRLGLTGAMFAYVEGEADQTPTEDNLGAAGGVYYALD